MLIKRREFPTSITQTHTEGQTQRSKDKEKSREHKLLQCTRRRSKSKKFVIFFVVEDDDEEEKWETTLCHLTVYQITIGFK